MTKEAGMSKKDASELNRLAMAQATELAEKVE